MVAAGCALWWLLRNWCPSARYWVICGSSRVRAAATRSRVLASARCERSRRCQAGSYFAVVAGLVLVVVLAAGVVVPAG